MANGMVGPDGRELAPWEEHIVRRRVAMERIIAAGGAGDAALHTCERCGGWFRGLLAAPHCDACGSHHAAGTECSKEER